MNSRLSAVLLLTVAWSRLNAAEEFYDRLVVAASYQSLPGENGSAQSVDFVRAYPTKAFSIGGQIVRVADDHWNLVRVGAHEQLRRGLDLYGGLDAGPGVTQGESFTYEHLLAGATIPVAADWRVVAQDTYVDVDTVEGHLTSVGFTFRKHRLGAQFDVARSMGGTIDERSADFRIDFRIAKSTVLAGWLVGDSNNRLLVDLPISDAGKTKVRQFFGGATVPLGGMDLTAMFDIATSGGVRRQSVSVIVGVPLVSR
jgi:hypothetical protein